MHDPAFADENAAILKQDRRLQGNTPDSSTKTSDSLVIVRKMLDKSRPILEMIPAILKMIGRVLEMIWSVMEDPTRSKH